MLQKFDYKKAFSRNIGWLTNDEQARLRASRVAIAGLGGVGGAHLLTLVRLGIGSFRIADFDHFDLTNFNRQSGASMQSVGRAKAEVLMSMAKDINPELDIEVFDTGVNADNIDRFLDGVDAYVDGLDFFAFEARQATFSACAAMGVPAVTAAPLGMGVAWLNFLPGGMTFEEYLGLRSQADDEKALRFLIGLSPRLLQDYLVDESQLDLSAKSGPSTAMACDLCAGVAGTQVLKILLGRGAVLAAPRGGQFDAYRDKMVRTWRPGGHRNPLQQLTLFVARRRLAAMRRSKK